MRMAANLVGETIQPAIAKTVPRPIWPPGAATTRQRSPFRNLFFCQFVCNFPRLFFG
jgi:hypothetical protein